MSEEQADSIIQLLTSINSKLDTLDDIHIRLGDVESRLSNLEEGIYDVNDNLGQMD